ncbi:unnamed protein product [Acanthosepion pharaonis]|uniref:Uncharacterized protein n=1 Tax=Acanthosepion pharaonis TaxID=158019 RepID=A0A812CB79_ACAPH|nr:unnamed protein product [Sepia pharaonis]
MTLPFPFILTNFPGSDTEKYPFNHSLTLLFIILSSFSVLFTSLTIFSSSSLEPIFFSFLFSSNHSSIQYLSFLSLPSLLTFYPPSVSPNIYFYQQRFFFFIAFPSSSVLNINLLFSHTFSLHSINKTNIFFSSFSSPSFKLNVDTLFTTYLLLIVLFFSFLECLSFSLHSHFIFFLHLCLFISTFLIFNTHFSFSSSSFLSYLFFLFLSTTHSLSLSCFLYFPLYSLSPTIVSYSYPFHPPHYFP